MAQNNQSITPENMTEWMACTGFLFPRNELELACFEILYKDTVIDLTDSLIDPEVILGRKPRPAVRMTFSKAPETFDMSPLRMVARKGGELPQHILDKMKKNQQKHKDNDSGAEEKKPE
jgi:hypothetical protein